MVLKWNIITAVRKLISRDDFQNNIKYKHPNEF